MEQLIYRKIILLYDNRVKNILIVIIMLLLFILGFKEINISFY